MINGLGHFDEYHMVEFPLQTVKAYVLENIQHEVLVTEVVPYGKILSECQHVCEPTCKCREDHESAEQYS